MNQQFFRWSRFSTLVCVGLSLAVPAIARAETELIGAEITSFQNRVELMLQGGLTRLVRSSDYLGKGDTIRTDSGSRVDLRFNEGSFVRVGERSTFEFIPNTRQFRLTNGTTLLLVPPDSSSSTIETPNMLVNTQSAAVVVRHFPPATEDFSDSPDLTTELSADTGRTAVMVLTEASGNPVEITLRSGRQLNLSSGQMAILDNRNLYLFEFDLALFYRTSPLLQGLFLDDPTYQDDPSATAPVRQETAEDISNQQDFEGDYLLNPSFLSPDTNVSSEGGWLFFVNPPVASDTETTRDEAAMSEAPTDDDGDQASPLHSTSGRQLELSPPEEDPLPAAEPPGLNPETEQVPPGVVPPPSSETSPSSSE